MVAEPTCDRAPRIQNEVSSGLALVSRMDLPHKKGLDGPAVKPAESYISAPASGTLLAGPPGFRHLCGIQFGYMLRANPGKQFY
jgi:hypothetical protein